MKYSAFWVITQRRLVYNRRFVTTYRSDLQWSIVQEGRGTKARYYIREDVGGESAELANRVNGVWRTVDWGHGFSWTLEGGTDR